MIAGDGSKQATLVHASGTACHPARSATSSARNAMATAAPRAASGPGRAWGSLVVMGDSSPCHRKPARVRSQRCDLPLTHFALPSDAAAAAYRSRQRPQARFLAPRAVRGSRFHDRHGRGVRPEPPPLRVASRSRPARPPGHRPTARGLERVRAAAALAVSIRSSPRRDATWPAVPCEASARRTARLRAAAPGPPSGVHVG